MVTLIKTSEDNIDNIVLNIRKNVEISKEVYDAANQIIEDVKKNGDEAIIRLTKNFDGIELEPERLVSNKDTLKESLHNVNAALIASLKKLKKNIRTVELKRLKMIDSSIRFSEGYSIRYSWRPIESVGCYAPGGGATYLSTILMTGVPGKVAGVSRMVLATPPRKDIDDMYKVMAAAYIAGFDEILWTGGAQAIAALAYGTQRIKPVKKIIGPGNRYVTAAKQLVQQVVGVDFPAGPTELVAIVDETSDLESVVFDMAAQSEHGPDSLTIAITTSEEIGIKIANMLEELLFTISNESPSKQSLKNNCYVFVADSLDTVCRIVNKISPEHLVISIKNHGKVLKKIRNVGVITVGKDMPSVFVDYYSGTSHVLPTGGYASYFSGLTVLDYIKLISIVSGGRKSVRHALRRVEPLIRSEGLPFHLEAFRKAARVKN